MVTPEAGVKQPQLCRGTWGGVGPRAEKHVTPFEQQHVQRIKL